MSPESIFDALLSHEAMALFEFRGGGVFTPLAALPAWCDSLWQAGRERSVPLAEKSPFLENFLAEAELFWSSQAPGSRSSGYWVEQDSSGKQFPLEASALWLTGKRVVLIRHLPGTFRQQERVFQTARDALLTHERLVREIEKKEILLHCIIHDLSQPLTSMRSCFELLLGKKLTPDAAKFVLTGRRESQRQERMIRGLLEAFAADLAGETSPSEGTAVSADLISCARRTVEQFAPAFTERGIQLVLARYWDFVRSARVVGDAPRVDRIFGNLLDNALRYSPKGSTVTVGVEDGDPALKAFVDDEGPGLPKDSSADRLFALFGQGKDRPGKVGLGLYFCKMTVERWGGTIGAENLARGGTRFWFRLPRAPQESVASPARSTEVEAPAVPRSPDQGSGAADKAVHIVVADDDEISRELVIETLRARGHRATGAGDGAEALAAFERLKPQVLLIDQHMPEMDGLEVARAIRQKEKQTGAPRALLIGWSGNASAEDERRAKQAGMDALVGKPFEPSTLFQLIERPRLASQTPSLPAPPEDLRTHLRRMTAGDDKLARKLVVDFLADFPKKLSAIERAVSRRDADQLASAAHSLRGAFALFNAQKSVVAAGSLEAMGRDRHLEGATEQFRTLSDDLSRLEGELRTLFPQPPVRPPRRQPSRNRARSGRRR
jgi:signal transduction histidine kinase/DNA-binding NarL/FixJ family response regulator